jgi:hypothetical protein
MIAGEVDIAGTDPGIKGWACEDGPVEPSS